MNTRKARDDMDVTVCLIRVLQMVASFLRPRLANKTYRMQPAVRRALRSLAHDPNSLAIGLWTRQAQNDEVLERISA